MNCFSTLRAASIAAVLPMVFAGADWMRFRGPGGVGSSDEQTPATWSDAENIVWETALPGFGASSPITLGEKIFLTCYSGYGLDEDDPGEQENLRMHVTCLDRASGKLLWDRRIKARLPEQEYKGMMPLHGYASATPVTDGSQLYVFFGRSGVFAFDLDGKLIWSRSVGSKTHVWGSAASPILAGDLLIVNASIESESLYALNKATGKVAWQAGEIEDSWSTPALVTLPDGKQELVVSIKHKVLGFVPETGVLRWECGGVPDYVCPMVIAEGDVVYITGGRKPTTVAVRCGGVGDVTASHLLWKMNGTPKVASPVYHDGYLYWVNNRATASCVDAKTGETVYEERLKISGSGDRVYASAVRAGDNLYFVSREDGTVVLAAKPEFNQVAHNHLGDDSTFNATPTVSNGQLLIRSDRFLYCIGE